MKTVVEAWGKGDISPARAALDDDVVWISAATDWDNRLRSGGVHRGRASVIALLSKIATGYFNVACKAKEIVSKGDIVWGLFDFRARYVGDGDQPDRMVATEMAFRWRVHDGKIVEAQTFFDTANLLAQQGQLKRG
jgi:ketosteroid isomerase-like protein